MDSSDVPVRPSLDIVEESDRSIKIGDIYIPPPPIPALSSDYCGPRLIITELSIKNFKSYAGERKLGPFHKNFTAIVGPNGSGKSNVIDALLFVFGYRAQKIRSKKVSVLIHKSERYPNIDSCSVTVHFATIKDEGESFEVLPDSRFSVTRTGFRDNSSVYNICGKRAQYKEVSKLLRQYGIDLEYNRFLILQGEIELIAMMKPKGQTEDDTGMLEYLEDIVGSNRYIEPIQHFCTKVEELNELRIEKMTQLKLIEKEKQDMEGPKNEAVEYLRLENKITLIENSLLQVKLKNADSDLQIALDNKKELDEKLKLCLLQQEELQLRRKLKEQELEILVSTYENSVKVVEDFKEQYNELERKDVVCREKLNHAKNKIKKMVKSLDTEEQLLQNLKKQPAVLKTEAIELEAKLKDLEAKKLIEDKKFEEVMKTLDVENKDMREEKEELELELVELKNTVNETKSEMDIAESELALFLSTEKNEKEKLEVLLKELEENEASLNEKTVMLKEAEEKVPQAELKLATAKQQLEDAVKKEKLLSAELSIKRVKVEEIKSSFNASHHRNAMLQAFLKEKEKGRLTGVYGRLGDLGAIDEKYDIAVSTACGDLDNIVTDTLTTAQECVDFLKKNDLGYTTFIALDKMKIWEPSTKKKISTPENVPRLFDLISVKDESVLTAFYYSLKNTLVANDLEQATRIGLQGATRYRIVTLKGELIDLSGTMSGGGGKPLKGRMGQSVSSSDVSQRELDEMVAEVETLIKTVLQLKENISQLEQDIEKTTREISTLQHTIKKNKLQYNAFKDNKVVLSDQVKEQKQKIILAAPDKKIVNQMEKKIAEKKKNYTKASDAASVIETQVNRLKDKLISVTEGKFKSVQERGEQISKEIDKVRQAMTKTSVSIKTSDRKTTKCEEKVTALHKDIEEVKKNKEILIEEFNSLAETAKIVLEKKSEAEKNVEDCTEKKSIVYKEIQIMHKEEHQLKSDHIEHRNNVKICDANLREKQSFIKTYKAKLSKLKLHDVEEEEQELPTLTSDELSALSVNSLSHEMGIIEAQMNGMKPDLQAIQQYRQKEAMYNAKLKDLEEVVKEKDLHKAHYDELRKRRLEEFMKGFTLIATKLKEMYQMLTLGGDAELELLDSLDPFSEGISFSVRPPKKSWKAISNLSGGEKTLSSLALVFALHYYRPTPFYVMDEIDAALDFKNVSIVGCYVKERTKNAQFIIISLRNSMFELSNYLVGIFKTNNCTNQVVLKNFEMWFMDNGTRNEDEEIGDSPTDPEQIADSPFDSVSHDEIEDSPVDPVETM